MAVAHVSHAVVRLVFVGNHPRAVEDAPPDLRLDRGHIQSRDSLGPHLAVFLPLLGTGTLGHAKDRRSVCALWTGPPDPLHVSPVLPLRPPTEVRLVQL